MTRLRRWLARHIRRPVTFVPVTHHPGEREPLPDRILRMIPGGRPVRALVHGGRVIAVLDTEGR